MDREEEGRVPLGLLATAMDREEEGRVPLGLLATAMDREEEGRVPLGLLATAMDREEEGRVPLGLLATAMDREEEGRVPLGLLATAMDREEEEGRVPLGLLATAMDREEEGRRYLQQRKIPELLHHLSALLLFQRPEKPREFLIQTLEKIKLARMTHDYPYLMDESNLNAMFDMLDTAGQGYITVPQYKGALQSLGLSTDDIICSDADKITSDVFKENVMKKFAATWAMF